MRNRRWRISLALAFVALSGLAREANAQRPMTLVDLLEVPAIGEPRLSPDGRQILYTLSRTDWKTDGRVGSIWRVNADGTGSVQLTSGAGSGRNPIWSPDGRTIAFIASRGDGEAVKAGVRVALEHPGSGSRPSQIFLLPNDGGEARQLTRHPTGVNNITWSQDGQSIYFLAFDPYTAEEVGRDKVKDDVFAFDEAFKQQHLWKASLKDGSAQRITSGDFSVLEYSLSRDGRRIVFHRAPDPNILQYVWDDRPEVWVMDADGKAPVQLTNNRIPEQAAQFSPDGAQVLFLAMANQQYEYYYNRKLFVIPAAGGDARVLAPKFPYEVEDAAWSKDGKAILFTANMGVHSELFELSLAGGEPKQLTDGKHAIRSWSYEPDVDRQVFTIAEADNPGDIWTVPTRGKAPARVTNVFAYLARDFKLPRQEKAEWKGADGVTVEGILSYPLDYKEGQRYPLVVHTHGGPQSSDKFGFGGWSAYTQVLTAKGYAVLQPNYRGSTGYGDDFLRDMLGNYFRNSHLDVMAGVDHLIKLGIADPDRLVKMGWSGGGHMTNKLITFTDRFKAASAGAGAANWVSMYAQSDMRVQRTPWFGGTPWQKEAPIEAYWNASPLKYVSNVKTPTIFLVGENDVRVPASQSIEMYRGVKSTGTPTHLYIAPREPHGWRELRHQLFKMNVELDWFEKYARGQKYIWEKAPGDKSAQHEVTLLQ